MATTIVSPPWLFTVWCPRQKYRATGNCHWINCSSHFLFGFFKLTLFWDQSFFLIPIEMFLCVNCKCKWKNDFGRQIEEKDAGNSLLFVLSVSLSPYFSFFLPLSHSQFPSFSKSIDLLCHFLDFWLKVICFRFLFLSDLHSLRLIFLLFVGILLNPRLLKLNSIIIDRTKNGLFLTWQCFFYIFLHLAFYHT